MTPEELVRVLDLSPHPEGGWFRETYRSGTPIPAGNLPEAYGGTRSAGTAILYLLTDDAFSSMHRLRGEEMFHFYLGDPVEMFQLKADGTGEVVVLGHDIEAGMRPQVVVPGGVWQGARVRSGGKYALLGTTMFPGFDYADFELGERAALVEQYPEFAERITSLTRTGR